MVSARKYFKWVSVPSVAAAILYNSWPLGHWLNPTVSKHSLASGLEAPGQPYNWVFIWGDILSSILIIIVCFLLWRRYKNSRPHLYIGVALFFVVLFGIGTIVDAVLPEHCIQGVQICQSFTQDHTLLLHGLASILASVFLFVGLCVLWIKQRKNSLVNTLLAGYVVFGLISFAQAIAPGRGGNWSQDYYISLCSIWLAALPYVIYREVKDQ